MANGLLDLGGGVKMANPQAFVDVYRQRIANVNKRETDALKLEFAMAKEKREQDAEIRAAEKHKSDMGLKELEEARETSRIYSEGVREGLNIYVQQGPAMANLFLNQFSGGRARFMPDDKSDSAFFQVLDENGQLQQSIQINPYRRLDRKEAEATEQALRKEFVQNTRGAAESLTAFATIESFEPRMRQLMKTDDRKGLGAYDFALTYMFIKGLSPGIVTDREIAGLRNTSPKGELAATAWQRLMSGELLTDTTREEMFAIATQQKRMKRLDMLPDIFAYSDLARDAGVDPDNVVIPRGSIFQPGVGGNLTIPPLVQQIFESQGSSILEDVKNFMMQGVSRGKPGDTSSEETDSGTFLRESMDAALREAAEETTP